MYNMASRCAVSLLLLVCISGAHSAVIGWGHECYQNTGVSQSDPDSLTATAGCQQGVINWNYPQYTVGGLKVTWNLTPGSKVCITDRSQIDLLRDSATDLYGNTIDLSPLNTRTAGDNKVCVSTDVTGKQTFTFYSAVWTYVQSIEYTVK